MPLAWFLSLPEKFSCWPLKRRGAFVFAAGAFSVPALPPYGLWLVLAITLPLLYAILSTSRSAKTAFLEGWLFAFGYFGFGLMWIGNALLVEGNPFSWVWPLAIAGLPALLGLFYGVMAMLLHRFRKPGTLLSGWLAFVGGLALTEWLRGHLFTGFPWNLYGYAWNNTATITQSVWLFGSYGLTLVTIFWALLPSLLWCGAKKQQTMALCLLGGLSFLGLQIWGYARLSNNPIDLRSDVVVRLVQPNIPQEDKWDSRKANDNARKLLSLTTPDERDAGTTTLIIWPETAVTETFLMHPNVKPAVQEILETYRHPAFLLTGLLRREIGPANNTEYYYNSLATYDSGLNQIALYDKFHLVPFGEYIPLQNLIPLDPFVNFSGFERGKGAQTQTVKKGITISPLVCYEIIFPHAVTNNQPQRPDLIVNVTNDAWYGDSAGPRQHLAMARFRAIEEGISVARAANTGISGLFDPYGRLLADIDLGEAGAKNISLPRASERGPYSALGDCPFAIMLASLFVGAYFYSRKGKH
ncbi:MAG: apolipoprotein N-acyltransferase [Micavibrio aeruginosavorus]|uniref:Apolipoprotein N-acyltransferase n=1 Tax=Micavibrio aeruginosavorus TaxID=349221 RepID=A0A7T5UH09_9BACT|nr:MAG: apolipoprotein N-acyltransferase [Micavibrio aeruginosavorus]